MITVTPTLDLLKDTMEACDRVSDPLCVGKDPHKWHRLALAPFINLADFVDVRAENFINHLSKGHRDTRFTFTLHQAFGCEAHICIGDRDDGLGYS